MKRQDEFLRDLSARLAKARNWDALDVVETVQNLIDERLPLLKPVVYENHDLSSGLSWDGHIVCGDRKSIQRVKNALHYEEAYRPYLRHYQREQTRRIAAEKLIADAIGALRSTQSSITPGIGIASLIDAIEAYLERFK